MKQVTIKLSESNAGEDRFSRHRKKRTIHFTRLLCPVTANIRNVLTMQSYRHRHYDREFNLVTRHFIRSVSCRSATDANVNVMAKAPAGLFGGLDVNVNLPHQYSRTSNESSLGLHSRSVYPRAMSSRKAQCKPRLRQSPLLLKPMQTLPWTNGVKNEIGFPVSLWQNDIKNESRWTIVCSLKLLNPLLDSLSYIIVSKRSQNSNQSSREPKLGMLTSHVPL